MDGRFCLPRMAYPGVLLTFDGVDGSGKSTLLAAAGEMAREAGRTVHATRVPPQWSRQVPLVRQFLYDPDPAARAAADFLAVNLILMADRLQQLGAEILPRLDGGEVVLCDRYVFHAFALADAMGQPTEELALIARRFPMPDAAVFLAPSPEVAVGRVKTREHERDRHLDEALLARQAAAYRGIAAEVGGHVVETDGPVPAAVDLLRPVVAAALAARP
jgi:dTMP kinase